MAHTKVPRAARGTPGAPFFPVGIVEGLTGDAKLLASSRDGRGGLLDHRDLARREIPNTEATSHEGAILHISHDDEVHRRKRLRVNLLPRHARREDAATTRACAIGDDKRSPVPASIDGTVERLPPLIDSLLAALQKLVGGDRQHDGQHEREGCGGGPSELLK